MNISLNWLKEYIDIALDKESLKESFNLMSAEVARLEKLVEATNLKIGYVEECIKHPDADKLHVCKVNIGNEKLQIICGAANVAKGQKVIVAVDGAILPGNFKIKKAKIRNVESNGMICSLEELGIEKKYHQEDGIHVLPDDAPIGIDPLQYMGLDDYVLELDLTPNRADLLSHIGVAYDLKAIIGEDVRIPSLQMSETSEKNLLSVFTETNDCMSYYARVIKNIKIGPSPLWMRSRLIACGVRPINNVVDITNYVMLETGQPLHAFDYDKTHSNQIIVRQALNEEEIITLDGKKRLLSPEDVVITDGSKPIAIAGVMGGIDTEVDEFTTNILLEAATFNPIAIRKTSKRLDLRSESSIRFERGLDPARTRWASNRASSFFAEYCQGEVLKGLDYFDVNVLEEKTIKISLDKIKQVTGYQYSFSDIENVFTRLSFRFRQSDDLFLVHVPTRRQDINTYQDLIEEIVRIHGYYHIPLSLPITVTNGQLSLIQKARRKLRQTMIDFGINEVVTYSLVSEKEASLFDNTFRKVIKVLNPLSEEKAYLRHSQLPNLINVLIYNLARKQANVNLFEIGKGYFDESEIELVSGIMSGLYQPTLWQKDHKNIDFFLVKGIIVSAFNNLGIDQIEFEKPEHHLRNLHPGLSAIIRINGKIVGFLGRLHPRREQDLGLDETYVFEIELDDILSSTNAAISMKPISKYPSVTRDLALVVDDKIEASKLTKTIFSLGIKALKEIDIFDVYQGEKVGFGQKSIALTIVFQDDSKTMATEDVDGYVEKILIHLENSHQASLRCIN